MVSVSPELEAREKFREKVARFRQVKKEQPHVHHDALELKDARVRKKARLLGQIVQQHAGVGEPRRYA